MYFTPSYLLVLLKVLFLEYFFIADVFLNPVYTFTENKEKNPVIILRPLSVYLRNVALAL